MSLLEELATVYAEKAIDCPNLKIVTLAQWILESARGTSELAIENLNFAGLKWHDEMEGYATKVVLEASDRPGTYCKFSSLSKFIDGYWKFLSRAPYTGWNLYRDDPEGFIEFIGHIYTEDPDYVNNVKGLISEAQGILERITKKSRWIKETDHAIYLMEGGFYIDKLEKAPTANGEECGVVITDMKSWFTGDNPPNTMKIAKGEVSEPEPKALPPIEPPVPDENDVKPDIAFLPSPDFTRRRNGMEDIDTITMHDTDGNFPGSLSLLRNSDSHVSADNLISREGRILQLVKDSNTAWHPGNPTDKRRFIGIEYTANRFHQRITVAKKRSSIALIRYLMKTYNISLENIRSYRDVGNTDCLGLIEPDNKSFEKWKENNLT